MPFAMWFFSCTSRNTGHRATRSGVSGRAGHADLGSAAEGISAVEVPVRATAVSRVDGVAGRDAPAPAGLPKGGGRPGEGRRKVPAGAKGDPEPERFRGHVGRGPAVAVQHLVVVEEQQVACLRVEVAAPGAGGGDLVDE